jgi:hypothetical protein
MASAQRITARAALVLFLLSILKRGILIAFNFISDGG